MFSLFTNLEKVINCDPNNPIEVLEVLEKYWAYFHVITSKSMEDYMLRKISVKRVLITLFFNLSLFICGLRFTIIEFFDNISIKIYFADFTYMSGNSIPFCLLASLLFLGLSVSGN